MSRLQDLETTVTGNEEIGGGNFLVEIEASGIAERSEPGQFVMLGIPESEILLRRPFSICGVPGTFENGHEGCIQLLYKIVGKGTRLLSRLNPGARVTLLGPLGRGFELPSDPRTTAVLVAGGIGSAPFPALASAMNGKVAEPPVMFYGAGTSSDLPLLERFQTVCRSLTVTTDDGSMGEKEFVTEPFTRWLDSGPEGPVEIFACGPEPMLRVVGRIALERDLPCQMSLEAYMACGFGVCIGCVVPTFGPDGEMQYERVCCEGPVMRAERLAW